MDKAFSIAFPFLLALPAPEMVLLLAVPVPEIVLLLAAEASVPVPLPTIPCVLLFRRWQKKIPAIPKVTPIKGTKFVS